MQIDLIRGMLDRDRVPTQRQRAGIHRALTSFDISGPNPCPGIPDFLTDLRERLSRIDTYYTWLVTQGPYAARETAEIAEEGLKCVTLGGEMRSAFAQTDGDAPGIYVCTAEKVVTRQSAGTIEIDFMRYLASSAQLDSGDAAGQWGAGGTALECPQRFSCLFIARGQRQQVVICETRKAGVKGTVDACAFAWATSGSSLIGVDMASRSIFRFNADKGQQKNLIELPTDIDPGITPTIAIAPSGDILAYTCGRAGGAIDLSLIEFDGARPVSRVRKQFMGATAVLPFWSAYGEIGCLVNSSAGGDIISLPIGKGEGQTWYHRDSPQTPIAPTWSSTGKFIAFFQAEGNGVAGWCCWIATRAISSHC